MSWSIFDLFKNNNTQQSQPEAYDPPIHIVDTITQQVEGGRAAEDTQAHLPPELEQHMSVPQEKIAWDAAEARQAFDDALRRQEQELKLSR